MIKSEELRIGNILQFDEDCNILAVDTVSQDELHTDNGYDHPSRFEPVLLNEEWLIKIGFKHIDPFLLYYKKHFQIDFNIFSWETPVGQSNGVPAGSFYMIINSSIIVLTSVHQLQNLFFALTGQELEIK